MLDFYEYQIQLHQDIINSHVKYITKIKELLSKLKNENIKYNKIDEYYENNLIQNPLDKMINNVNNDNITDNDTTASFISQSYTDEQDLIRNRIKEAHDNYNKQNDLDIDIKKSDIKKSNTKKIKIVNKNTIQNGNELNKKINSDMNITDDTICKEISKDTISENEISGNPIVNKFSKYTPAKKLEIMSSIFKQAKLNIDKMSLLDTSIKDNLSENIQKEADRLLNVFISEN